jgi:hypothetical protein
MSNERIRAPLDLDLSEFTAKPQSVRPAPAKEEIAALGETAGFRSNVPAPATAVAPKAASIEPRQPRASAKKPEPMVRVAIDIPKALRKAMQENAQSTGLGTVRAVILDALKAKGFAISDEDLVDKRTTR